MQRAYSIWWTLGLFALGRNRQKSLSAHLALWRKKPDPLRPWAAKSKAEARVSPPLRPPAPYKDPAQRTSFPNLIEWLRPAPPPPPPPLCFFSFPASCFSDLIRASSQQVAALRIPPLFGFCVVCVCRVIVVFDFGGALSQRPAAAFPIGAPDPGLFFSETKLPRRNPVAL
jgi:hypothetical protein